MAHQSGARNNLSILNDRILQAEESGDQATLETLLAEDFTILRARGTRQDRSKFLQDVPGNANRGRSASPPEIRFYGECAVVISRVSTSRRSDGTPAVGHFWNTRVFVQYGGQWRCSIWQVTEIPSST